METPKTARRGPAAAPDRTYLALASHELRTPLHSANGFVEMVLDGLAGPLNERQREMLGYVHTSIGQLATLLEDVLFVARVDSGELKPRFTRVDPASVLSRALDAVRKQADDTNITVAQTSAELPTSMRADGERLREGLVGMLSSAIVLVPPGGSLELVVLAHDSGLSFDVTLIGVRLDANDMRHLFDRFYQPHPIGAERAVTLGLGLEIARITAAWHGGTAHADTRPDGSLVLCYEITLGES
jgi:signal transduction histidine kinase